MSKKPPTILVIVASVRAERRADEVLRRWLWVAEPECDRLGAHLEIADLARVHLPLNDEPHMPHTGAYLHAHTRRWAEMVRGADAFVVITPEYNHSMPASLKNAFDHLGGEWGTKPMAWVSYGNTSAGTRALVAAKQVATTLGLVMAGPDLSLRLSELDDEELAMALRSRLEETAVAALSRLVTLATALRSLRVTPLEVPELGPGYVAHLARAEDAEEWLVLQRCCWVDEAINNDSLGVPALHDTVDDVRMVLATRHVVAVRSGGRLVAGVQARRGGDAWVIGRLMVAPDHRRRGVGRALLRHIESQHPDGAAEFELHTGARSVDNLAFYESEGYVRRDDRSSGSVAVLRKAAHRRPVERDHHRTEPDTSMSNGLALE